MGPLSKVCLDFALIAPGYLAFSLEVGFLSRGSERMVLHLAANKRGLIKHPGCAEPHINTQSGLVLADTAVRHQEMEDKGHAETCSLSSSDCFSQGLKCGPYSKVAKVGGSHSLRWLPRETLKCGCDLPLGGSWKHRG